MAQGAPDARLLHAYPFVPSHFYFVPLQWLRDVVTTGDFDARHLLLVMCDGSDRIKYPESEREAHWTRNRNPRIPNVVSHVTYAETLTALQARGWLATEGGEPGDTEIYQLLEWPDFGGAGVLYAPRTYIRQRWPAWFGKNQWGRRAALTGLFACASRDGIVGDLTPAGPVVTVTTSARRIVEQAQEWLPALPPTARVGLGLSMLADLGLVQELRDARTARSRVFRFRSDALAIEPGRWPADLIAHLCGLDIGRDAAWVTLVQAFLTYNCRPPEEAHATWITIRRYARYIATPADAQAVLALLVGLGSRPDGGRLLTGVRRVLREFALQREAEECWESGPVFTLPLENGHTVAGAGLLPPNADARVLDTRLIVTYERTGRVSKDAAAELLAGLRLYVRQDAGQNDCLVHMFSLRPPLSRPDRWDIEAGSALDASPLHTRLDYARPFEVVLECARPSGQLALCCQFRILRSRRQPR